MRAPLSPRLTVSLLTLVLWALVAGSALFWWLRVGQLSAPLQAPVAGGPTTVVVDSTLVARALGATSAAATAPPDVAGRLVLRGVVTHGGRGAALIAVDGRAAKPLRVGGLLDGVDGDWRLRSVSPHAAVLVADGRELRLEMPAPAARSSAGDAVAPPPGVLGGMPLPTPPLPASPRPPVMPGQPTQAVQPAVPPALPSPMPGSAAPVTPQPQPFVPSTTPGQNH